MRPSCRTVGARPELDRHHSRSVLLDGSAQANVLLPRSSVGGPDHLLQFQKTNGDRSAIAQRSICATLDKVSVSTTGKENP